MKSIYESTRFVDRVIPDLVRPFELSVAAQLARVVSGPSSLFTARLAVAAQFHVNETLKRIQIPSLQMTEEPGEPPHEGLEVPVSRPSAMHVSADEHAQAAAEEPGPNVEVLAVRAASDAQLEQRPDEWRKRPSREAPAGVVAVRCLGPFGVFRDGRPFRKGWRAKSLELIAFLVANPSGAARDRIIEELWPETDPRQGNDLFYVATSTIRRRIRNGDDPRRYVERDGEVFRLKEGEWWVDVWEFEGLAREADRADDAKANDTLKAALSLYKGEFCADTYYPWADNTREHLRALFVQGSARLADILSRSEALQEALAILDRALEADPVCEDLSRKAMALEASLGRRAAALARYRRLEATLDAELSVEPDPETQALARRLARAESKSRATG